MTREEAITRYIMPAIKRTWNDNKCIEIISAIEQDPCDDAISRQAVLSMQYRIDDSATLSTRDVVNVDDIEDLPPVNPQPKTGHWIGWGKDMTDESYKCSKCGELSPYDYDFCPHCGKKNGKCTFF